ncbi:MAG: hypothetical protein R3E64_13525 [Halioglobus sp.]
MASIRVERVKKKAPREGAMPLHSRGNKYAVHGTQRVALLSSRVVALCLLPLALTQPVQAEDSGGRGVEIIGEAFDLNSERLLYRELHCASGDALIQEVVYQNPAQQLIARKTLNFSTGTITPSYVQRNYYAQESIAVELHQDAITTTVTREAGGESVNVVDTPAMTDIPLVIDAGFDAFVRNNWDDLLSGQDKSFYFPFAGRDSLVQLRIVAAPCDYDSTTDQCFRLELDNWLLRMVVAPIELGYDARQQRLMRYRGLSNIGDGDGDGLVVDIRYRYDDLPPAACS